MGMCKINGPDALPLRPAGPEKLGQATNNICEQYALYAGTDQGEQLPTKQFNGEQPGGHDEIMYGQGVTFDAELLHWVRHCERVDSFKRTRAEETYRREQVKARRKLKKQSKKLCKKLGVKYQ